jgi:hypothetical protein
VATKGNTGGCDLPPDSNSSLGWFAIFFLSQTFEVDITALRLCLTVRILEGIMGERSNNRGIRHTQGWRCHVTRSVHHREAKRST